MRYTTLYTLHTIHYTLHTTHYTLYTTHYTLSSAYLVQVSAGQRGHQSQHQAAGHEQLFFSEQAGVEVPLVREARQGGQLFNRCSIERV
jgi:hypothetical protein